MPAEDQNDDIRQNTSPSDARGILDDYKAAVVREFVVAECPELVSVERLEHAKIRHLKHDVGDALDEIKETLQDVATARGTELDTKTVARLEGAAQALENCDEQVAKQLQLFDGASSDVASDAEVIDVEEQIDRQEAADASPSRADSDEE